MVKHMGFLQRHCSRGQSLALTLFLKLLPLPSSLYRDFSLLPLKSAILVKLVSQSLLIIFKSITKTLEYFPLTSVFFFFFFTFSITTIIFFSQPLNSSRAAVMLLLCAFTVSFLPCGSFSFCQ